MERDKISPLSRNEHIRALWAKLLWYKRTQYTHTLLAKFQFQINFISVRAHKNFFSYVGWLILLVFILSFKFNLQCLRREMEREG